MHYTMLDKEAYERFVRPNEIIGIRVTGCSGYSKAWEGFARGGEKGAVLSGYYNDFDKFCRDIALLIKEAEKFENINVYMTLQVINPELIYRGYNKLGTAIQATSHKDVLFYRWLPIDLDPVKPSGISSSDEELKYAEKLADRIFDELSKDGWPAPIRAMSGNGHHLLFPLNDLPAQDPQVQKAIKNALQMLSATYSNEHVNLDTSIHDPARIIKLYGTVARKGSQGPLGNRGPRPHRESYIYSLGDN